MLDTYESNWAELNSQLREIELNRGGLDAALNTLEAHQKASGFIKADLSQIKRISFHHPEDPSKFFRIQFNPNRALRFKGSGVSLPPATAQAKNQNCFLCRDNIVWQQQGLEIGYEINVRESGYYAWMNPFPLLPRHIVIAAQDHRPQEWPIVKRGDPDISGILGDFIELSVRLPDYVGFYNGVNAGASNLGHLHFQFFKKLENDDEFPLERAARLYFENGNKEIFLNNYPLLTAVWRGEPQSVLKQASEWIADWAKTNGRRLNTLTANFIIKYDHAENMITFFFTPRDRTKSYGEGLSGIIGGLEVLGELVFTSEEDKKRLDSGEVDYFSLEKTLASVSTPFF